MGSLIVKNGITVRSDTSRSLIVECNSIKLTSLKRKYYGAYKARALTSSCPLIRCVFFADPKIEIHHRTTCNPNTRLNLHIAHIVPS